METKKNKKNYKTKNHSKTDDFPRIIIRKSIILKNLLITSEFSS